MGNLDSKFDDIILQNQRIEDWFISENQGRCQLWINKKTGRRFQAYTIPQAAASDPEQLQKYAFRKHHDSYIVSVEGVLRQANGFLCSHAGSSFVLVENITSRLSDHQGALTFQQGLYVLSAAANGYNTLNSFFGPLQPTSDMICINEVGHLKVWLNQNLAMNDPSPNARGASYNGKREALRPQDYALAKNRIKQCVARLFEVVEGATQGFPLRFKSQFNQISTYFQAVNFVQYFSEQNGIKLPDHLFPIPNLQLTRESQAFLGTAVTSQVVHGYSVSNTPFSQEKQNLGTSRINYVYKSNYASDSPRQRQEQSLNGPVRMIPPPVNNQQPKIAFQVRPPLVYQPVPIINQQPVIALRRVASPINNVQQVCFPPPNVGYTLNSVVSVPIIPLIESKTSNLRKIEMKHVQSKNSDTATGENGQMPSNFKIDIKRAISIEQTIYQPKIHYKEENYLVQEPADNIPQEHSGPYSEQQDIHEAKSSFQNHLQLHEQQKNHQRRLQEQTVVKQADKDHREADKDHREAENWRSKYEHLLAGSNQKDTRQHVEEEEDITRSATSALYSESYHRNQIDRHNKYYRSPIPEQSQTFSPTPNHKNLEMEEWEDKLNKFSLTGKEAVQSNYQNERKENREANLNPKPSKIQPQQGVRRQQPVVNKAELDPEELQRYVRAKYLSNTATEPALKQARTYNKDYSSQALQQISSEYRYPNYKNQGDNWKGQDERYSKLAHKPLQNDKISAAWVDSHDQESNQTPSFRPNNNATGNGKSIRVQPVNRQLQYTQKQVVTQVYRQDHSSHRPADRKRVRTSDTTKIDQKYNKYVLNSQKPKAAVAAETTFPMMQDLNLAQLNTKQRVNKKTNRSSEQGDKQPVTYGKLTSLLWEQ